MVELLQSTSNSNKVQNQGTRFQTDFLYIEENKNIRGINIFNNEFLYSAYADHTTFFVGDEDSNRSNECFW